VWKEIEEKVTLTEASENPWMRLKPMGPKTHVVFISDPAYIEAGGKLRIAIDVVPILAQQIRVLALEIDILTFKELVRLRQEYALNKWTFEIQLLDECHLYSIVPARELRTEEEQNKYRLPGNNLVKLLESTEVKLNFQAAQRDAFLFWSGIAWVEHPDVDWALRAWQAMGDDSKKQWLDTSSEFAEMFDRHTRKFQ